MGQEAAPHPTGGYRAYKKINGREFQFYSRDKVVADRKQREFNRLSALSKRSPFSKCGRLIGFRVSINRRKGRTPYIAVVMQVGPQGKQRKRQWKYEGSFESNWQKIKVLWVEAHGLLPCDVAGYYSEIRAAKCKYIRDVGRLEERLREAMCVNNGMTEG